MGKSGVDEALESQYDLNVVASNSFSHVESLKASITHDAVFGEIQEGDVNYRNVSWIASAVLMTKTQIGLGVLTIPVVFDDLGMIPGIICLLVVAVITTWSDYMIGVFKLKHPEVYSIDDVGQIIFGAAGRWIFGIVYVLYWTFVAGSGYSGISIALNALSGHGTCTAVFVAVACIVGFLTSSIPTLEKVAFLAWFGLAGILSSILTLTIGVGLQDQPATYMGVTPWVSDYQIIAASKFYRVAAALSSIVFAYSGTPAFFAIVSEMRDPTKYTRAMVTCQSIVTVTYITIGIVVYYFCGSYVASPALGSAGDLIKKVCYGLALPGLIATTMIVSHMPAKYLFLRLLRNNRRHITQNTLRHWLTWFGCTAAVAVAAYVIASAIPVFGDLVSLIGALFGTLMSFQPMGFMWLYDNWSLEKRPVRDLKWKAMVCFSMFVVVSGTFLMIAGTYGSVATIIENAESGTSTPWSCADNSITMHVGSSD